MLDLNAESLGRLLRHRNELEAKPRRLRSSGSRYCRSTSRRPKLLRLMSQCRRVLPSRNSGASHGRGLGGGHVSLPRRSNHCQSVVERLRPDPQQLIADHQSATRSGILQGRYVFLVVSFRGRTHLTTRRSLRSRDQGTHRTRWPPT